MKTIKNFKESNNISNVKFPWTIFDKDVKDLKETKNITINKSEDNNINETLMTTIWF